MMRTLDQCKAEVFRRSKERIRKRNIIRSCVLAACIPVVLCVGMWSVLILPAMMPASMADMAASENMAVSENDTHSIHTSAMQVVIESKTSCDTQDTSSDISADVLYSTITRMHFISLAEESENKPSNQLKDQHDPDYTITFTAPDGTQTVFTLSGSTLTNVTQNDARTLDPESLERLKQMLHAAMP